MDCLPTSAKPKTGQNSTLSQVSVKLSASIQNVEVGDTKSYKCIGAPKNFFSGGGQAMYRYLLSIGSNKTLLQQPGFC